MFSKSCVLKSISNILLNEMLNIFFVVVLIDYNKNLLEIELKMTKSIIFAFQEKFFSEPSRIGFNES